jgi:parallel beta-helix repeat protein
MVCGVKFCAVMGGNMSKRICFTLFVLVCQLVFGTLERTSYEFSGQVYEKLTKSLIQENYDVSLFEEPYDGVLYSIGDTAYYFITDATWHRVIYVRNCESDQENNYAKYLGIWGTGTRKFNAPHGVALDADHNVYIADTDNGRVVKLRLQADTLAWIDEIGTSVLDEPWDLEVEGNKLYVIDAGSDKVYRFSLSGNYEISYGGYGSAEGYFKNPKGIAIYSDSLYISDTDNRRIVALRDRGTYIEFLRWKYPDLYQNRCLLDIEVDPRGVIYVCDGARSKILKFSPSLLSHCYSFGDYGTGINQFIHPRGMFTQDTLIAIIEEWTDNAGIQVYKEVVRIKELIASETIFDATEENVTISFKIDDFSAGAELTVGDREWDFINLDPDEEYQIVWDGRHTNDSLFAPGDYTIYLSLSEGDTEQIQVEIKGTVKGGLLSADEHWTEEDEPYVLTNDVYLTSNCVLEIDPGVKVMPVGDFMISTYNGSSTNNSLIVRGSDVNPICFTPYRKIFPESDSVPKGFWKGIRWKNSQTGDSLVLEHCIIEAAGSDTSTIVVYNTPVIVSIINSQIIKSSSYGYWESFERGWIYDYTSISNSIYQKHDSIPVRVGFASIGNLSGNTYADNGYEAIEIIPATLEKDAIVRNEDISYWFRKRSGFNSNFTIYKCPPDSCPVLTIEPGAQMFFDDSTTLQVGHTNYLGKIMAQGTESDSIIFSALDSLKGWRGLAIYAAEPSDTSTLQYCSISYGGQEFEGDYGNGNIRFYNIGTPFALQYSRISNSLGCGIGFATGSGLSYYPTIADNIFSNNDSFPLVIVVNALRELKNNVFTNNNRNEIYVKGETRINKSLVWQNQGVPYIVYGGISVNGYGDTVVTVEIDSGNTIKFTDGGQLNICDNDRLVVHSTKDSSPWSQIQFTSASADTSIIDSCVIEHTDGGYYPGAICITESPVKITNSIIMNNEYGIAVYNTSVGGVVIENNQIILNELGIDFQGDVSNIVVQNNDIFGNKCAFEFNTYNPPHVQASYNWWGDASGPWDPSPLAPDTNLTGRGDSISDGIVYAPWLTSPVHAQAVTLTHPNGNNTLYCDGNYMIQWSKSVTPTKQELYYTTDFPEGGSSKEEFLWTLIDTINIDSSSYQWEVPATPSSRCRVAIKLHYESGSKENKQHTRLLHELQNDISDDKNINTGLKSTNGLFEKSESRDIDLISVDISDSNFSIIDTVSPQITLDYPIGSEYFIPTTPETILWQASDNHKLDHFNIYLSEDGGSSYPDTIIEDLQAPCSSYTWTVPEKNNYNCKIMIAAFDSSDNDNSDACDSIFYIPVKSFSDEMSAYNNATRMVRSFSANIHLVYATTESEKLDKSKKHNLYTNINQSMLRHEKQTRGDKVYYTKSTNFGIVWQNPTEIGEGVYPAISMNNDATKMGAIWQNSDQSEIYYRYWTPMGGWDRTDTIFSVASDITYSPPAIGFMNDTMHLTTIRTDEISRSEIVQDVLYAKFYWSNASAISLDTVNHWRITYSGDYPQFSSIAPDGNNKAHVTWERPPDDTIFSTFTPFDIYYSERNAPGLSTVTNVSNSDSNSINSSVECYGGHYYIVWQEKVDGYNIFLYKRNYASFPPSSQTDTISQSAGEYPVTSMGGVVLWAAGDTADVFGRIWDSEEEEWLDITNWSNTPRHSMYPQVDAWQDEGGLDIIAGWTEDTDTSGFGKKYVSIFPYGDYGTISFPSYYLDLGDSLSTPFTLYRDSFGPSNEILYDVGYDSLVYYLPYIDTNARCRLYIELYRPGAKTNSKENTKWKIKLNVDGIVHQTIELVPGELKKVNIDIPWMVNIDGAAKIHLGRNKGDCILARRVLYYEYETNSGVAMSGLGGPQNNEITNVDAAFFKGVYPNPTKADLELRFSAPVQQTMNIMLYDVAGRLVDEVFSGTVNAGDNKIPIRSTNLAAGIYFIRIEIGNETITEKVIILK